MKRTIVEQNISFLNLILAVFLVHRAAVAAFDEIAFAKYAANYTQPVWRGKALV